MKASDLDTNGCIALIQALVNRARLDFMVAKPGSSLRKELEQFFRSGYFETLTGCNGEALLDKLRKEYNKLHTTRQEGSKHDQ